MNKDILFPRACEGLEGQVSGQRRSLRLNVMHWKSYPTSPLPTRLLRVYANKRDERLSTEMKRVASLFPFPVLPLLYARVIANR